MAYQNYSNSRFGRTAGRTYPNSVQPTLKARVDALEISTDDILDNVEDVQADIATAQDDIDTAETAITAVADDVEALDTRVTAIEEA